MPMIRDISLHRDPHAAFQDAIRIGRLSEDEQSANSPAGSCIWAIRRTARRCSSTRRQGSICRETTGKVLDLPSRGYS